MKKRLFFVSLFIFLALYLPAQVTIGSLIDPNKGALLDLKENTNLGTNAERGLLLPRVGLTDINHLYPMYKPVDTDYTDEQKAAHIGLLVYNLTDEPAKGLCPGLYVWEGKKWIKEGALCSAPDAPVSIKLTCPTDLITGQVGSKIDTTLSIPYTVTGTPFALTGGTIGNISEISATITDQTLNSESGKIAVKISGAPQTSGVYDLPISIEGQSCSIKLNISANVTAPSGCPNNPVGMVFQQGSQWYAMGIGTLSGYSVAEVFGPYATEEDALRNSNLQMCSGSAGFRCIPVYDRTATQKGRFNFDSDSQKIGNIIVDNTVSCIQSLKMNPGEALKLYYNGSEYPIGMVEKNGKKYLGVLGSGSAILTANKLK
jgi:hypothetical protein